MTESTQSSSGQPQLRGQVSDDVSLPPIPAHEPERLRLLRWIEVLDTEPEVEYDDLTAFAREVFGVAVAQVSLIDASRQWIKSSAGLPRAEAPRSVSFCAHGLSQARPLIVLDSLRDERFRRNPLVLGPPHIRFYAGAPLFIQNGMQAGSFCLIDPEPRDDFSLEEQALLEHFAELAAEHLQTRREIKAGVEGRSEQNRPIARQTAMLLLSKNFETVLESGSVDLLAGRENRGANRLAQAVASSVGLSDFQETLEAARAAGKRATRNIWYGGRVARMHVYPIHGQFAVFLGDITDSWSSALAYQDLEQRYSLLLRATGPILWTYAPGEPTQEGLEEWLQFTGQSLEEFQDDPFGAVHPDDRAAARAAFSRAGVLGTTFVFEVRVRRSDGTYVWMEAHGTPRTGSAGAVSEWIGLHLHTSQRHKSEAEDAD